MQRAFRPSLVFAAIWLFTLSLLAQDSLRVEVELINIIATVTDATGKYMPNLTADDFTIEEDGVRQEIAHFSQDHNIPVSVGIVLDTSGSMDRKIRTARAAVDRFVRGLQKDDEVFLMSFSAEAVMRQEFTTDRNRITRALNNVRVNGGTALYDAVSLGLEEIQFGRHDKRALLVISDGQDTNSNVTANEVNRVIRRSELLVYGLGIDSMTYGQRTEHVPFTWPLPGVLGGNSGNRNSRVRDSVNMNVLRAFAESSGGRAVQISDSFSGGSSIELERILTQIGEELRNQYTLGYYPKSTGDGEFHNVRVRGPRGTFVRARTGYLAEQN